jgi:S-(hydroxymethyl)glutathione dehydrogenase / alcohol dehydrogenase
VDWYMKGLIQIDPMITHVLPLERINEAFHLMEEGKSIRSVVVY